MRRSQLRSRSISGLVLVVFSSVALSMPRNGHAAPANPADPPKQPIELRTLMGLNRHGGVIIRQLPFQGDTLLDGATLYRVLRREDLALAYERREANRYMVAAVGFAALVAGAFVIKENMPWQDCSFSDLPTTSFVTAPQPACQNRGGGTGMVLGVVLLGLGPILGTAAGTMDPNPISLTEKRALIDAFNATAGPQAPSPPPAPPPAAPPKLSLGATPTVSADGAGLMLRGAF